VTESVRDEVDSRLEYLPRVLIVTTNGLEVDLLLPPTPTANVHWAQAWKPMPCQCGTTHAPCDPADLVLVIGARDHGQHFHPGAFVVFVVPRQSYRLQDGAAQVVYNGTETFGAWAADVVLNLVGPQSDPSVWRYDLADLKRMMGRETIWSCVAAFGDLASMAKRVVSLIPANAEELHVAIAVPDNSDIYISDIGDLMQAIARSVKQDASIICSSSWGRELRVTVLYPQT
jgi:hypothetical protein